MNAKSMFTVMFLAVAPGTLVAQVGAGMNASAAVQATVAAGLPTEPVHRVIAQGRARGASEAQIERAAVAAHGRLEASRQALRDEGRPEPTSAEIIAGADAMLVGARPADLERVRESAPRGRPLVASLTAVTELTVRGSRPADAAATVASRLRAGASDQAILTLSAGSGVNAGAAGADAAGSAAVGAGARVGAGIERIGGGASIGGSVVGRAGIGGL
jgi:hypothetical protein